MLRASIASVFLRFCLFVVTTVPFRHLSEGTCNVNFPSEQWKPRVAYEASFNGKPAISIPPVGSGFNRTLNIDGFCNNVLMKPGAFTCNSENEKRGEFNAYVTDMVKAPTSAKLTFDNVNCPFRGISIRKTKAGAEFEAEIRFEFETCQAIAGHPASPVKSAAVVMGLRKEPSTGANLLPWMEEVCHVGTTTPAEASLVVRTEFPVVAVGNGKCKVADPKQALEVAQVTTKERCAGSCRESLSIAKATKQEEGKCTGYAFSATAPADKQCIIYSEAIPTEVASQDTAWACFSMELKNQKYEKTTVPPAAMQASSELTENLHLREVFAGNHAFMTTAKLMQVQPQTGDKGCFDPSWWFMLQDDVGRAASIPVTEAEWVSMMDMVPPDLKSEHEGVQSDLIIDRVLVKTCNPNAAGWGRTCTVPKKIGVCDHRQTINAIATGILVPFLGWLVVLFFHKRCGCGRPDVEEYKNFPICSFANIFGLSFIALLCCCVFAGGLSTGISYAFGAAGCLHGVREMVVVGVAVAVPASLAMVVGLLYMHNSREQPSLDRPAPGPIVLGGQSQHVPAGHKLMLVEVPEGAAMSQARPLNPDVLQTGTSAMASYPHSRIDIQGHHQDPSMSQASHLSGFQSLPPNPPANGSFK